MHDEEASELATPNHACRLFSGADAVGQISKILEYVGEFISVCHLT